MALFRIEKDIPYPIHKVVPHLAVPEKRQQIELGLEFIRTIHQTSMESGIIQAKIKGNMLLSSREILLAVQKLETPDGRVILGSGSYDFADAPALKNTMRVNTHYGTFILSPNEEGTHLTYLTEVPHLLVILINSSISVETSPSGSQ